MGPGTTGRITRITAGFATTGAPGGSDRVELVAYTSALDEEAINSLAAAGRMMASSDPKRQRWKAYDTVDLGDTGLRDQLFVLAPVPEGEGFDRINVIFGSERRSDVESISEARITFLHLVPVTREEMAFAVERGSRALLEERKRHGREFGWGRSGKESILPTRSWDPSAPTVCRRVGGQIGLPYSRAGTATCRLRSAGQSWSPQPPPRSPQRHCIRWCQLQCLRRADQDLMTPKLWFGAFALVASLAHCPAAALEAWGAVVPRGTPRPFALPIFEKLGVLTPTTPAFTPDSRRMVFTTVNLETPGHVVLAIFESRFDGQQWSPPVHAKSLLGRGFNSHEPAFSPDGQWLYFVSNRPPGSPPWNVKIFRARVTAAAFEAVELAGLDVPAAAGTFYPQLLPGGALMFTTDGLPGKGGGDLFIAHPKPDGAFQPPVAVEGDFNSDRNDWDLVETPDGRSRFWASERAGGAGGVDIWFSRKNADGGWSPAQNLVQVNTPDNETAPRLTPDGAVLFLHRTVNGRDRIYWVETASVLPSAGT
jgi:hypothetical protein